MQKVLSILFLLVSFQYAFAQEEETNGISRKQQRRQKINELVRQEEEGVITYHKHTVMGFKLTTDGYGGFIEVGRGQSKFRSLLFQLEITERKHRKEIKQQVFSNTAPIIYGKINYFYPIKLGVQQQFLFGNKSNKNGISVTANGGGGIILGLLRPYLVDVEKNGFRTNVGYESPDSSYFLNGPYYGGPGFGVGWSQTKVRPGLYLKSGIRFDYGKYNEMVNALECGIMAEFYSKEVAQMIYTDSRRAFYSLYVGILFGRRK